MGFQWLPQSITRLIFKNVNEDQTLLNDLSNELILEIFDYLSFNQINFSFGNLNIRFNNLIESYPHHFDFQSNELSPNHIRSLKINQRIHLARFFSLLPAQLLSLRGLCFSNIPAERIHDVFKQIQLFQLQYIYLGFCPNDGFNRTEIMASVQREILTLGQYQLKRCHFKNHFVLELNDIPGNLSSLKYLQITGCKDFYHLSQLLSHMPSLKCMQVSTLNVTKSIPVSISCCITHLILRPHSNCSTNELDMLLKKCCSSLKRLVIESQMCPDHQSAFTMNKHQWLTIFPYQLTNFHFKALPHQTDYQTNLSNLLKEPLREKIWMTSNDQQEHYCQVVIDPPFIEIWQQTN